MHTFSGMPEKLSDIAYIVNMDGMQYCVNKEDTPEIWVEFEKWMFSQKIKPIEYKAPISHLIDLSIQKRNQLFSEAEWRISRYETQIKLNQVPNDTEEVYLKLLQYLQDLRDITKQEGYPANINWPILEL